MRDASILVLAHFDEASATFVNSGVLGGTFQSFGFTGSYSADAGSKFGSYCYKAPAASSDFRGAQLPISSGVRAYATGPFMLSGWVKLSNNPVTTARRLFGLGRTSSCPAIEVNTSGTITALLSGASPSSITSAAAITLNQWVHVETHRDFDGVWRLLLDGVVVASATPTGVNSSAETTFDIGGNSADGSSGAYNCLIDEVIFMRGYTDHAAAFTPETSAYANPSAIVNKASAQTQKSLQEFAPTYPIQFKGQPIATRLRSENYGGLGKIVGTVKLDASPDDIPVARRVRLIRERDGVCMRETWSDPVTGAYQFLDIDPTIRYTVISYDYAQVYRAVAADNLLPEVWVP